MTATWEYRLSGSGGQGLILAGVILADAAIRDGKNAVQAQSYGPEARGGASKAEVIISDGEIDYPKVVLPDVVLAMSQEAADKYAGKVKKGGLLIVDNTYVKNVPPTPARVYGFPISRLARERTGKELVANMVALGVLVGLTGAVSRLSLQQALLSRIPGGTETLNMQALEAGFELARASSVKVPA
ncbi:2-oxoacid:ferredoxin oxidoreductase subunit gamma [Desulfofundulus thermobenzoicus]|uniref:2-oxoacid:ferredoxin oxidoreductase subunit gamma n=1 Tax=Desulfofundulus thermobenzoicus TaxID=29376 RepID=A0A6N7IPI8_9FIRM|nr:2-oxoacid:acceptor oxidoreductase family protein [Desulfofundulus thermobenzoicus]MQL51942.1 2-oxoacid:ferredoxin oxidoreductase subunit gamma [Desulfofundulus thermobenzoicus]